MAEASETRHPAQRLATPNAWGSWGSTYTFDSLNMMHSPNMARVLSGYAHADVLREKPPHAAASANLHNHNRVPYSSESSSDSASSSPELCIEQHDAPHQVPSPRLGPQLHSPYSRSRRHSAASPTASSDVDSLERALPTFARSSSRPPTSHPHYSRAPVPPPRSRLGSAAGLSSASDDTWQDSSSSGTPTTTSSRSTPSASSRSSMHAERNITYTAGGYIESLD